MFNRRVNELKDEISRNPSINIDSLWAEAQDVFKAQQEDVPVYKESTKEE